MADEPVTKQDLLNAVADLKGYVDERSEKVETRLLSAFHGWARAMEGPGHVHYHHWVR